MILCLAGFSFLLLIRKERTLYRLVCQALIITFRLFGPRIQTLLVDQRAAKANNPSCLRRSARCSRSQFPAFIDSRRSQETQNHIKTTQNTGYNGRNNLSFGVFPWISEDKKVIFNNPFVFDYNGEKAENCGIEMVKKDKVSMKNSDRDRTNR